MTEMLHYWYDSSAYSTSGEVIADLEELMYEFDHLEDHTDAIIDYDEDELEEDWDTILSSTKDEPYKIGKYMQVWIEEEKAPLTYIVSMGCSVSKVFNDYNKAVHHAIDDIVGKNTNLVLIDIHKEPENGYALIKYKNIALNSVDDRAWWRDEPDEEIIEEITVERHEVN